MNCYRCGNVLTKYDALETQVHSVNVYLCETCGNEEIHFSMNLGYEPNYFRMAFPEMYGDRTWSPTKECLESHKKTHSAKEGDTE